MDQEMTAYRNAGHPLCPASQVLSPNALDHVLVECLEFLTSEQAANLIRGASQHLQDPRGCVRSELAISQAPCAPHSFVRLESLLLEGLQLALCVRYPRRST